MDVLSKILAFWRNPVFTRYFRSRLRLRRAIFWYLLAIIVPTFIISLSYLVMVNSAGVTPQAAARRMWIPLLSIQGLILMVKGTGVVAAGIIQDKLDQTLDYQRLAPLSPSMSLVGYLFGLPVLELIMFSLTLPHLAFILVVGQIPIAAVISVYVAFFVCVVLYHMTAIAVGLVMNRWVLGYLLSIFMVVTINIVLPITVAQLGLKFVQFLSVWPVISQKILPLIIPEGLSASASNPFLSSMASDVSIFNWRVSPLVFTLFLQGSLILTFFLMARRRWQSATKHSLSKPYALAFLAGFILLVIGNVWPAITGQYLPFPIFGQNDLDGLTEFIAVAFPGIFSLLSWVLTGVLLAIVVPSHHSFVRGIRRAMRMGRSAPRPWEDESGNLLFMTAFPVVVMAGFFVLYSTLTAAGYFEFRAQADLGLWRLPLALAMVLVYTTLLLQTIELKPAVLVVLLLWFVPMLVAAVVSAATQQATMAEAVVASLSPIALLVMASAVPLIDAVPIDVEREFDLLLTGCTTGLIFLFAQIVWLAYTWRRKSRAYAAACTA